MKVKYAAPAATVALAVIAALLFILLVNDEDPVVPAEDPTPTVPAGTPTLAPTFTPLPATATPTVAPNATATPSPNSTPIPTAQPTPTGLVPTATTTVEPTRPPLPTAVPTATPIPPVDVPAYVVPGFDAALLLPDSINPDLERQPGEVVLDTWSSLFIGRLVRVSGILLQGESGDNNIAGDWDAGNVDLAFCNEEMGVQLSAHDRQTSDVIGEMFTWSLTLSPAGTWFSPNLTARMLNPALIPHWDFLPDQTPGGQSRVFNLTVEDSREKLDVFDLYIFDSPVVEQVCSTMQT